VRQDVADDDRELLSRAERGNAAVGDDNRDEVRAGPLVHYGLPGENAVGRVDGSASRGARAERPGKRLRGDVVVGDLVGDYEPEAFVDGVILDGCEDRGRVHTLNYDGDETRGAERRETVVGHDDAEPVGGGATAFRIRPA